MIMNEKINYRGVGVAKLLTLSMIGANFATEKNEQGIAVINTLNKQLYIKTVLASRLLKLVDVPEDRVMSIEQFNSADITVDNIKGIGKARLKADFDLFKDMLEDEIKNILAVGNDCMTRLDETIKTQITPEFLEKFEVDKEKALKQMDELKGDR